MVKLIEVDPEKVNLTRKGRRGRVSYPILKMFLESGKPMAQLDREGAQQSFQGLYSSLRAYIVSHSLPIQMWSQEGEIFLARTDTNAEGVPNQANNNMADTSKRDPDAGWHPERAGRTNADPTSTEEFSGVVDTANELDETDLDDEAQPDGVEHVEAE